MFQTSKQHIQSVLPRLKTEHMMNKTAIHWRYTRLPPPVWGDRGHKDFTPASIQSTGRYIVRELRYWMIFAGCLHVSGFLRLLCSICHLLRAFGTGEGNKCCCRFMFRCVKETICIVGPLIAVVDLQFRCSAENICAGVMEKKQFRSSHMELRRSFHIVLTKQMIFSMICNHQGLIVPNAFCMTVRFLYKVRKYLLKQS